jgi:integrase
VDAAATVGYTQSSFRDLVVGTSQFARFLTASGITDVRQLRDHHVQSFIGTLPVCQRKKGYSMPAGRGSRAARSALRYLRASGIVPPEPAADRVYTWVLEKWIAFLYRHRGLAASSVALYRRNVEPFLQELREDAMPDRFAALSPMRVREYLQHRAPRFARVTRKNLVITLRSFLRFAFGSGYLQRDVAGAIERVPCFTLDRLPRGPKWEDLPKMLATIDRGSKPGRRNFAILLTLMTYGVRAGQLTSLRLDDVNWRDSQIIFPRAKRGRPINAPLTAAVGDALLQYIREGRPVTRERRVFLSLVPPYRPLAAGSVYNVAARAWSQGRRVAHPHHDVLEKNSTREAR